MTATPTTAPTSFPIFRRIIAATGLESAPVKLSQSPSARLFEVGKFDFGKCVIFRVIAETREQAASLNFFGKVLFVSA